MGKSPQARTRAGISAAKDGSGSATRLAAETQGANAWRETDVRAARERSGQNMTSLTLDRALSRRIELAEAEAAAAAAEALTEFRPDAGVAVARIAGGFAVYCGANSPVTQAVGLGLDGPVDEEEFDALELFYASRKEPVRVETSPLADPSLIEQFGKRHYRVTEFTNVMARSTSE